MPMRPASAEFMNNSRITFAAYGTAMHSISAFSALAITSFQRKCPGREQPRQAVQRSWQQRSWAQHRPPSTCLDHRHLACPTHIVRRADVAVEPDQVRAAAEEHML